MSQALTWSSRARQNWSLHARISEALKVFTFFRETFPIRVRATRRMLSKATFSGNQLR